MQQLYDGEVVDSQSLSNKLHPIVHMRIASSESVQESIATASPTSNPNPSHFQIYESN